MNISFRPPRAINYNSKTHPVITEDKHYYKGLNVLISRVYKNFSPYEIEKEDLEQEYRLFFELAKEAKYSYQMLHHSIHFHCVQLSMMKERVKIEEYIPEEDAGSYSLDYETYFDYKSVASFIPMDLWEKNALLLKEQNIDSVAKDLKLFGSLENYLESEIMDLDISRSERRVLFENFKSYNYFWVSAYPSLKNLISNLDKRIQVVLNIGKVWKTHPDMWDILPLFDEANRFKLLTSTCGTAFIRDILSMQEYIPTVINQGGVKDLLDLHDKQAKAHDFEKNKDKLEKRLKQGFTFVESYFQNYEIHIPSTGYDLYNVGQTLNNCVFSYTQRIVNRLSFVFYLSLNKEIIYCIELDPHDKSVIQFNGKNNKPANEELLEELQTFVNGKIVLLGNHEDLMETTKAS